MKPETEKKKSFTLFANHCVNELLSYLVQLHFSFYRIHKNYRRKKNLINLLIYESKSKKKIYKQIGQE